jgi:hypothetical protein
MPLTDAVIDTALSYVLRKAGRGLEDWLHDPAGRLPKALDRAAAEAWEARRMAGRPCCC